MERDKKVYEQAFKVIKEQLKLEIKSDMYVHAFSRSFIAEDETGRKHEVKICVRPKTGSQMILNNYLLSEIEIHKTLKHDNIVQLYDAIVLPECTILDMEFCDMSLTDFVQEKYAGILPEPVLKIVAKDVTSAVCYLHSKQFAHRDIKPENVMIKINEDDSFIAKLSGFYFSRKDDMLVTHLGTPIYEAPEIFAGDHHTPYTNRCDLWSLGAMYYQLATGSFPIDMPRTMNEIRERFSSDSFVGLHLPASSTVSEICKDFIEKHLMKKPEDRISAVEAMKHPFLM